MKDDVKNAVLRLEKRFQELSPEEIISGNERILKSVNAEYQEFCNTYQNGKCYLCGRSFDDVDEKDPCVHILLRRANFKKELYAILFDKFEYYQIASYLRWVANEDVAVRNINDLKDECADNKIFNETIVWKNIEWTLDCSQSDFEGHRASEVGKEPHWHIQIKQDGLVFIKFNDFHIKFKDKDLITMSLIKDNAMEHTYGEAGLGMQKVVEFAQRNPEQFITSCGAANDCEEKAAFRIQSVISAPPGKKISGEDVCKAMEMSKKTGKLISVCLQEILGNNCSASVMVSPHDRVPKIAKRGKRK